MSRRYDSRTTMFSPEGRLYQVEYAMDAVNNAGSTLGLITKEGVILCGEKKTTSKLLDKGKAAEKVHVIDDHVLVAVAGIIADANILVEKSRVHAQRHRYQYDCAMPVEQLIVEICDLKQTYTQYGGLRPFGVSFLFAGWDVHEKYQLYQTDPAGNYMSWQAHSIGTNNQTAQGILKQEWKEGMTLEEGYELVAKVLAKTMDTATPTSDSLEFQVLQYNEKTKQCEKVTVPKAKLNQLLKDAKAKDEEEKAKKDAGK